MTAVLWAEEPSAKYLVSNESALLRGFPLLAAAPNGVAKLRELILEFAICGKLVPQFSGDEPAPRLVAKAQVQREPRTAGKRSPPPQRSVRALDALPSGWCWSSLCEIGLISPRNEATNDTMTSFVQMSSVPVGMMDAHSTEPRPWRDIKSGFTHFAEGDVGVAKITPCFENGKSTVFRNLTNGIGAGTTELHVVRPLGGVLPEYILAFLKSPKFLRRGEAVMTGSAGQKRLPRVYFESSPFPLPPLAEQHRIVARVEELMNLCDALEQSGRLADEQHARLTSTLFDALAASESAHALDENWQRIAEHFDLLLDRPEAIDALEQTILQLAVRGLLVSQDGNDEAAGALVGRLRAEQDRLIAVGQIRREKVIPPLLDDDCPFELPSGWAWVRLGTLANFIDYRGRTPVKTNSGVPLITAKNVRRGFINREPREYIAVGAYDGWMTRGFPRRGDLLFTTEAPLGNVAAIDITERFAIAQRVICLGLYEREMSGALSTFLQSQWMQDALAIQATGVTAQGIKSARLQLLPIPVPPLAEQHRIVARVEELRRLCAQLRERLFEARRTQSQLADALVAEIAA